jgi:hypothetical protein
MSQPKEPIPIETVQAMADALAMYAESASKAVADYLDAGFDSVDVEGWKTLVRGLEYTQRILKKLVGPASRVQKFDTDSLLLPRHKTKKDGKLTESDREALKAAEMKVNYRRGKRRPSSRESS